METSKNVTEQIALVDELVKEIYHLKMENQRLSGIKPELPSRDATGELTRYGIRWNGPTQPLAVPMADGSWVQNHEVELLLKQINEALGDPEMPAGLIQYLRDLSHAKSYDYGDYTIDRVPQSTGPDRFAVRSNAGLCLTTNGEWEYEPLPSNRDDEFYKRCRFASFIEARNALRLCQTNVNERRTSLQNTSAKDIRNAKYKPQ